MPSETTRSIEELAQSDVIKQYPLPWAIQRWSNYQSWGFLAANAVGHDYFFDIEGEDEEKLIAEFVRDVINAIPAIRDELSDAWQRIAALEKAMRKLGAVQFDGSWHTVACYPNHLGPGSICIQQCVEARRALSPTEEEVTL